jgi:hypothetical protein
MLRSAHFTLGQLKNILASKLTWLFTVRLKNFYWKKDYVYNKNKSLKPPWLQSSPFHKGCVKNIFFDQPNA